MGGSLAGQNLHITYNVSLCRALYHWGLAITQAFLVLQTGKYSGLVIIGYYSGLAIYQAFLVLKTVEYSRLVITGYYVGLDITKTRQT